jgi:hypothetical protein
MMAMRIVGTVRIAPNLHPDKDAVMPVLPLVSAVLPLVVVSARVLPYMTINMRPGAVMRAPLHMGARLMTRTGLRRHIYQDDGACQDDSGNELFQHNPLLYGALGFGYRFGLRPDSSLALAKRSG